MYQTKKLDLPGIGSFQLDPSAVIPQESDRMGHVPAAGITFKNANIAVADEALVLFIKEHTGKMKSLASADLDFYLTTGKQLLNIGKPFHLEGIGTLLKNKDGRLDFTPGEYVVARLDDLSPERKAVSIEESTGRAAEPASGGGSSRQVLLLLGLVAGLVVIGWGGYYLYKRNNIIEPTAENKATILPDTSAARRSADSVVSSATRTDSPAVAKAVDTPVTHGVVPAAPAAGAASTAVVAPPAAVPNLSVPVPGEGQSLYRFVILQTGNKNRALRRYNQLLGYQLNIHMDEKDSSYFKLYFPIAAGIRDTTHIKDSLADVYAAQVSIEK
ncbi:hypothetical protein ACQ86N_30600 [Puia sp. P3]|uniref:hypothetical protein n=1 Tax=Puia sp. P3 TaxID=3423952 RepID=UPI003D6795C8